MPYIISTHTPDHSSVHGSLTSRAVATLEEAHEEVQAVAPERYVVEAYDAVLALPESGGTIGPLPDGTVIEVERKSWDALAMRAVREARQVTHAEILDAFNAS